MTWKQFEIILIFFCAALAYCAYLALLSVGVHKNPFQQDLIKCEAELQKVQNNQIDQREVEDLIEEFLDHKAGK